MTLALLSQRMTSWHDSWWMVLGLPSLKMTLILQLLSTVGSLRCLKPSLELTLQKQPWKPQKGQGEEIHRKMLQALTCPRMRRSQGFGMRLGSEWRHAILLGTELLGLMTGTEMREGEREERGLQGSEFESRRITRSARRLGMQQRRQSRKGRALGRCQTCSAWPQSCLFFLTQSLKHDRFVSSEQYFQN